MVIKSQGSLLIKNTVYNFITQVVLLLLFMITTPIVVHGLGDEAYGIISLVLVLVGYFSFLDLGMSQATVKFLSEHLAKGEEKETHQIVLTSIFTNLFLGILGGILIALFTSLFVEKVFKVSLALQNEAKLAFYIFAFGFPFVLIQGTLQAIPTAFQRFDIINIINGIAAAIQGLGAMILVLLGFGIREVVILYLVARVFSASFYLFILLKLLPNIQLQPMWHKPTFLKLLSFGGWILVSALTGPLISNFDRIVIGSLLSVAAVTYYVVPYSLIGKISIFPASMSPVLFPAFSALSGTEDRLEIQKLFVRSTKYIIIIVGFITLIMIFFAEPFIRFWLGDIFAQKSTLVFQILAIGALFNCLAPIPSVFLQGYGRPDLPSKLYLALLPINIVLVFVLVKNMGIEGAAISFTLRAGIETLIFFLLSLRFISLSLFSGPLVEDGLWKGVGILFGLGALLWFISILSKTILMQVCFSVIGVIFFIFVTFYYVLDERDRTMFYEVEKKIIPAKRRC